MPVPVVAIAVSVSAGVFLVAVIALVCVYKRRKRDEKYKQYSQVAKNTSLQLPPCNVRTEKQIVNEGSKGLPLRDTLGVKMLSASEESLSPAVSSDDTFYDALERYDSRRSMSLSSRDPSPTSANEDEEDEEDEVYPEGHIGRLWFNIQYSTTGQNLVVTLVKARNLPSRSKTVRTCDPFVKIALLPKDKHVSQSRCKRKTKRPTFNETFYIPIAEDELDSSTLQFTVFDGYRMSQQAIIGEAMYPLIDMESTGIQELWRDLEKPIETTSELGDIHISLSYYPTLDRLTIIILRAANLRTIGHKGTDPFVKIAFSIGNKVMKTKKTAVHQDTVNPMFNDAFNYTVTEDDLGTSSLLVSVWHSGGGVREDKLIGRVLLGGMMYARGKECEHWTEMMTNPRKMIKYWHPLGP
ncbi:synaptotagmin-15 isoform X2 [Nematostella vectensis]|uniref:synaptotagmin-15 isoform X2 n=1 Tax=Nematostella vectensis TaxID=45351 RepID=UPI002076EB10|nr:synaptotagmin-15 isoform X2 [Nematostella vectensis]